MAQESTATATTTAAPSAAQSTPAGDLDAAIAKAVAIGNDGDDEAEGEAKPEGDKAAKKPARRVEALAAKAVAATQEADPGELAREKARAHLQRADVAKAIDAAFGDLSSLAPGMADAIRETLAHKLGVGSKNWELVRKHEARAKRELAEKEQHIGRLVDAVKRDYAPFAQAKALYDKGDYDAAFKAAFGEDPTDFQRKIISQRVGRDPEVERLKAELQKDREERQREREQYEQAQRERSEQAQIDEYKGRLQNELSISEDPAIARYASRPQFVAEVFEILRANYNPATGATVPIHLAAEHVRDRVFANLKQWQLDHPGQAPSAAQLAPKSQARPMRTLKQTGAAEATGTPRKLTSEEIRLKHQRLIEAMPAGAEQ